MVQITAHSPPGDLKRGLFALPIQIGIPIKMCTFECSASKNLQSLYNPFYYLRLESSQGIFEVNNFPSKKKYIA